jgi:hypothetical protein
MLETVVVNEFGDTKQNFVIDPNWPSEYAAYRAAYEAAPDKAKFNAEYLKGY